MSKKVLVLMGGFSAERDISLITGKGVAKALKKKNYNVVCYDLKNGFKFVEKLKKEKPDVVFNALHGNFGEDGEIQGMLDVLQIPYTHSGLKTSILGMDKNLTKFIAAQNGIPIADSEKMTFADFKKKGTKIKIPYVVKPVSDGSSVGVYIVKNNKDKEKVFYENDEREILVEKFIKGQEITISVLNGKALGITEIRPKVEFYNYEAKYTDGITQHIIPAEIPVDISKEAKKYAETLHQALGCHTISRCDFIYNSVNGVVFLEINTNPGMTPLSLVPEQAKYAGLTYEDVCVTLVEEASCRRLKE